jgi:hypothetical protein
MGLPAKTAVWRSVLMKKSAVAYKRGSKAFWASVQACLGAAISCSIGIAPPVVAVAEPGHGETSVTCSNPYSGVIWQIKIDYDRRTVDSNPAQIDDGTISWRDAANGWYYVLDRKSGKLTVTLASATGGNFLHDQCKLDH